MRYYDIKSLKYKLKRTPRILFTIERKRRPYGIFFSKYYGGFTARKTLREVNLIRKRNNWKVTIR